jgi:membrane protein involved in colicin uptake
MVQKATNTLNNKETKKKQRNKETKKQRNKETKKQRNKETKKQRNKGISYNEKYYYRRISSIIFVKYECNID